MSTSRDETLVGPVPRGKRRAARMASFVTIAALGVGLAYVAAPGNDWYLPGQVVTLRTSVEYSINGHLVMVDASDDGSSGSISVNTYRNHHPVVPGDSVGLGLGQRLRVVSIDQAAQQSGGSDAAGGTGSVTIRLALW